jgi:hypothetical protein
MRDGKGAWERGILSIVAFQGEDEMITCAQYQSLICLYSMTRADERVLGRIF